MDAVTLMDPKKLDECSNESAIRLPGFFFNKAAASALQSYRKKIQEKRELQKQLKKCQNNDEGVDKAEMLLNAIKEIQPSVAKARKLFSRYMQMNRVFAKSTLQLPRREKPVYRDTKKVDKRYM